jgi:hypothetical protein
MTRKPVPLAATKTPLIAGRLSDMMPRVLSITVSGHRGWSDALRNQIGGSDPEVQKSADGQNCQ